MPTFTPVNRPGRLAVAGLVAVLSVGACKEFTSIDASFANITGTEVVYALNGGPPGSANALRFFDVFASRADQGFGYDIAFDIDEAGRVVIIPAKALATSFSNPYSVGLQTVTGPFEALLEAPEEGYRVDTAMAVAVGQTVVVESLDNGGSCRFSLKGQSYFSKLVITAIDVPRRRIDFTFTVNRNCGFRSFAPGIPRD